MTATPTRRRSALAELRLRLQRVLRENGFASDAGLCVIMGERPVLGPDDPPQAFSILPQPDELGHQGENVVVTLPVLITISVRSDISDPWMTIEDMLGDVKVAIENTRSGDSDHDLVTDDYPSGVLLRRGLIRGQTQTLEREEGSEFVGVAIEYRLMFAEGWGTP